MKLQPSLIVYLVTIMELTIVKCTRGAAKRRVNFRRVDCTKLDPMLGRPPEECLVLPSTPKSADADAVSGFVDRVKELKRKITEARFQRRSTPYQLSFLDFCDYIAYYCLRSSTTGTVCGRSLNFHYYTFSSYCMIEYMNCREKWDVWDLAYVGECGDMLHDYPHEYKTYPYENDYFLDQYYPMEYDQHGK